jgi:hypothetical protein
VSYIRGRGNSDLISHHGSLAGVKAGFTSLTAAIERHCFARLPSRAAARAHPSIMASTSLCAQTSGSLSLPLCVAAQAVKLLRYASWLHACTDEHKRPINGFQIRPTSSCKYFASISNRSYKVGYAKLHHLLDS